MPSQASPSLLILGGSGFLSGTLAQTALSQGYRVWAVTRGLRALIPGVTGLVVDRHDAAVFKKVVTSALQRWDLVVDCIGYDPADALQDITVFQELTDQLIFISTDFVYDPFLRKFPQGEEAGYYVKDGYGGKKRLCEIEFLKSPADSVAWTILRPCHIYGPGSQLGCLPLHRRDAELLSRLKAGEPLRLVGGGHFLQHPIFAHDLAETILSLKGNPRSYRQIFNAGGPELVESVTYFKIIADILGVELKVEEIPVSTYLAAHPEDALSCCNRIYDLSKLRASGASLPSTPLEQGLREHVGWMLSGH